MSTFLIYHSILSANIKKQKILKSKKGVRRKCRICWRLTGCILLFNNELRPNIDQEIYSFTGVRIKKTNNLPDYICVNCIDLLDSCIRFRSMCRLNNDAFTQVTVKQENVCSDNQAPDNEDQNVTKPTISEEYDREKQNTLDNDCSHSKEYEINETSNNEANDSINKYVMPSIVPDTVQYYYKNVAIKRKCKQCHKMFADLHSFYEHLKCQTIIEYPRPAVAHQLSIPNIPGPCFGPGKSKDEQSPHLCDTCGKTFHNYLRLRAHMVIHENIFPFKCDKCPYKGRTRSLLTSHVRSHMLTSERAYKCPHCPKITTTRPNLKDHIQRMHNANERKYKCTHCEKMFKCKPDLKRHFVIVHENKGTTKCDVCFKVFNKKHLKKHLWRIHKIEMEKSQLPNRLPSYILCNQMTEEEPIQENTHNNVEENGIQWFS